MSPIGPSETPQSSPEDETANGEADSHEHDSENYADDTEIKKETHDKVLESLKSALADETLEKLRNSKGSPENEDS